MTAETETCMKNISIMIKPASSLCNMRCGYCFYNDVSSRRSVPDHGVMSAETRASLLASIKAGLKPGDNITIAFQGGEPTLAGLDWMKDFVEHVSAWDNRISRSFAIQTNGLLLDDQWCDFLAANRFLTGVSLDMPRSCHDRMRVDSIGNGTYTRVNRALDCLKQHGAEFNVLCTLTSKVAGVPKQVWNEITRLDLKYIQFTPCLSELDDSHNADYALTPGLFASFYNQLFKLWLDEYDRGKYRSIKLIDDIVNLLAFGEPHACGMLGKCQPQIVVEADGSVYPCDFYCTDEWCVGNVSALSLEQMLCSPVRDRFISRDQTQARLCEKCEFAKICGGGCQRMRRAVCLSGDNSCCGYRSFLRKNIKELERLANQQRRLCCR